MKTVVNLQTKQTETVPLTAEEQAQRDAEQAAWEAEAPKREALAKIAELEASISPRRQREATLGDVDSIAFIQGIEDQIAVERAKL